LRLNRPKMANPLEYRDVAREDYGMMMNGSVRINTDSLKFSNKASGKVFTLSAGDVDQLHWIRMGNVNAIKAITTGGILHRFAGFPDSDFNKISSFFKNHWQKELEKEDHSIKGWNYGAARVEGQTLVYRGDDKLSFEIPLSNVSQVPTGGGKSEATLEFHPNEDAAVQLVEMRLHKPAGGEDGDPEELVEQFRQSVMRYVEGETDLPLVTLQEILCATPRGRYDIKVFSNRLAFHGKSYDYKVPFNTISRMFLLPHKDQRHIFFVLSIHPPIRQGQTRYPFIVLECLADDEVSLELSGQEQQLEKLCTDKENRIIQGRLYEILSKIFRTLTNVLITVPADMDREAMTCLVFSCAFRQASGYLYPLEKGFMYVHKPPMYIRFDELDNVHFARSDATTRSFDFEIVQRNGTTINFSNIAKEDYNTLFDFVQKKGLKVRNAKRLDHKSYKEDAFAGSDDEELDPYKETLKANAASDDDSDSDDEDFDVNKAVVKQQEEEDSSAGSGSEPDEEYDSAASDVTDDMAQVQPKKAKKEKSEKKEKSKEKSEKGEKSEKKSKKSKSDDGPSTSKKSSKKSKAEESSPTKKNISKEFIEDDSSSEGGNKSSGSDSGEEENPITSAPPSKKSKKKASNDEDSDMDTD
jgi:structure-specific recognition protein 1